MRFALSVVVGLVFTSLLLVLPATHGGRWLGLTIDSLDRALIAFPFFVLVVAALRPRPWLTLWGFPAAHLPALVVEPGLTSGAVFGESGPVWAALALGVSATGWFLLQLWPPRPAERRASDGSRWDAAGVIGHPLSLLALALALAIFGAFGAAAFSRPGVDPVAGSATVLVGAVVVWVVVAHYVAGDLGDVVVSERKRRRARARLLLGARASSRRTWVFLVVAGLAVVVAVLWYLFAR